MAKARAWAGLTQAEMANKLKSGLRTVNRYERSDRPPYRAILAYSNVTGVPAWWIEGGNGTDPDQGEPVSRCTRAPWEMEGYRVLNAA